MTTEKQPRKSSKQVQQLAPQKHHSQPPQRLQNNLVEQSEDSVIREMVEAENEDDGRRKAIKEQPKFKATVVINDQSKKRPVELNSRNSSKKTKKPDSSMSRRSKNSRNSK